MKTGGLFNKLRRMRIIVVLLGLLLSYGALSYSPRADTPNSLHSVDLGGVTGATNNTIFAYGRYVLIAPFWPSTGIAENGDIDPSLLDNDSVYMIDTKKPDAPPIRKKLSSWDSQLGAFKTIYFPSKVAFDPNTNNLYVRGTRLEANGEEVIAKDAIAYVGLVPDEKGKADFDSNVVTIDIQGVPPSPYTGEAPLDFAFSSHGELMVFTNGASIFSFSLAEGYLNSVEIVSAGDYNSNNSITFLDVDSANNIISVCQNQKWIGEDEVTRVSSQLSFYKLGEDGTFELLKRTEPGLSSDGTALIDGSNITIVSDADSQFALFATNDGSVCTVDLSSEGDGTINRLHWFSELAQSSIAESSPLLVHYDPTKRIVGIVKPGFTVQITRPLNGKPGRITRPINLHIASETPVLALAKLNKKYKVMSSLSFAEDFIDDGGLTNLVIGQDSRWLISTYSGKLYSIEIGAELQDAELQLIGSIGSRVDRFAYYADRTSVVAISAFTLDEDGMRIASSGSLVFGKLSDLTSQPESIVQALLPTASMLGKSAPTIRRPCNIRR